jgi:hypothetical protein
MKIGLFEVVVLFGVLALIAPELAFATNTRNLIKQRASLDQRMYYVLRDQPRAPEAANMLATVSRDIQLVLNHLQKVLDQNSLDDTIRGNVALLLKRYPYTDHVYELDSGDTANTSIAYNENKAERIFVCLRREKGNAELGDANAVMYVMLHELAHTMVSEYDPVGAYGQTVHSPEFRKCEKFMHETAQQLGLLNISAARGKPHCGAVIP